MFDEFQLGLYEGKMNERERIIELIYDVSSDWCSKCDDDWVKVVTLIKGENK